MSICGLCTTVMKILHTNKRGFTLLGVVIAIAILAAFGASMTLMVAANQRTRAQVLSMDQGFGSVQAGFEFTLRQILVSGSTATSFTRNLARGTITITRSGGLIRVTATQGSATAAYQIEEP